MTSIAGSLKQIPLNNGYFRPVPALLTNPTVQPVSSFMYTLTSAGALTGFTPNDASVQLLLSTGACLLKDMGTQYLSTNGSGNNVPRVLRRVQIVVPGNAATNGVGGVANGLDSDYNCAYIEMGFNNAAVPGPFIRTG
jgi:hypothetical protein